MKKMSSMLIVLSTIALVSCAHMGMGGGCCKMSKEQCQMNKEQCTKENCKGGDDCKMTKEQCKMENCKK